MRLGLVSKNYFKKTEKASAIFVFSYFQNPQLTISDFQEKRYTLAPGTLEVVTNAVFVVNDPKTTSSNRFPLSFTKNFRKTPGDDVADTVFVFSDPKNLPSNYSQRLLNKFFENSRR